MRVEKAAEAARLRAEGLTYREIAERMGISRSYANGLVTDPDGSQDKERKAQYGRPCLGCGEMTDGSNGREKAPDYCYRCTPGQLKKWTQEVVIEAIREWARRRGSAPKASEWLQASTIDSDGYQFPCANSVYGFGLFESWSDAIEAAGFPHPGADRNYNNSPWEVENMTIGKLTRDYLVFRVVEDGELSLFCEVEAVSTSQAIENTATEPGRYAAVAKSSLMEYRVASRMVASKE